MKNPSLKAALAHIFLASSVAAGVLGTACCAQGPRAVNTLLADIPFSFTSGAHDMPAGRYAVTQMSPHIVVIRSTDLKHTSYVSSTDVTKLRGADRTKLTFHRYGDQNFLYQVWTEGSTSGVQVQRSHTEQEMLQTRNQPLPSMTEVASVTNSKP